VSRLVAGVVLVVLYLTKITLQLFPEIHIQLLLVHLALVGLVLQMGEIVPQHYLLAICLLTEVVGAW
jgi:hypothetical protein